jgi:hypothetical protein
MSATAEMLSIEYALTSQEVWEGYKVHQKHASPFGGITGPLVRGIGVLMIVAGAFSIWQVRDASWGATFALCAGFYLLFGVRWAIANAYKRNAVLGQPYRLTITEERVEFLGDRSRSELSWDAFTGFVERNGVILLYQSAQVYHILPIRAFAAPQLEQFRAALGSHLKPEATPQSKRNSIVVFWVVTVAALVLLVLALRNIR